MVFVRKALFMAAFWVVSAAMVLTTSERVRDWNDELGLWHEAMQLAPQKPRLLINYGNSALQRGQTDEATWAYRQAMTVAARRQGVERDASLMLSQANLAVIQAQAGHKALAVWMIRIVERKYPRSLNVRGLRQRWERELGVRRKG